MIGGLNTSGGKYSITNNAYGNVTSASVQPARRVTALVSGKTYYFVNAQTGMALTAKSGELNADVVNHSYDPDASLQKWTVEGNAASGYRLKVTSGAFTGYLGTASDPNVFGVKCITVSANYSTAYSTFKLLSGDNGTFTFRIGQPGYANALDAVYGATEIEEDHEIRTFLGNLYTQAKSQYWYAYEVNSDDFFYRESYSYSTDKNHMLSHTDITGAQTLYAYDSDTGFLIHTADPNNTITSYSYNDMGMVTGVQSGSQSVGYTYTNDFLTGISVTNGPSYAFTFDALGRLTGSAMGGFTLAEKTYNGTGLLTQSRYAGDTGYTAYTYDSLDRPASVTYNNQQKDFYYGADGLLAQTTDTGKNSRTLYVYDQAGRIVAQKEYSGTGISSNTLKSKLTNTYMAGDNRISSIGTYTALGTNTLSFTYGDLSQNQPADNVYEEKWNGTTLRTNTFDALNRLSGYTIHTANASLNTTYTYRVLNSSTNRQTPQVSQLSTPAGTYTYTYDAVGNILSEKRGAKTTSYEYDNANRLTRENNQTEGKTYVYTYDAAGNITSRKTYAYTTGTLGTVQATDNYTYTGGLLTQYGAKTITYSGVTVTGYGDYAVSWYKSGLLSNYSKSGDTHTYTYSMDGVRLSKTDNGTTTYFYYAGDLLVGQKTGSNALVFKFDHARDYVGFTYGGNNYWYVKNLQNDVVAITDDSGSIIVRYYYDAWGRLLHVKDYYGNEITNTSHIAHINPIRYRSYYYDTETGFYFLNSRYYDPEVGRFISADDPNYLGADGTLTGYNLFAYCGNNPVTGYDPDGTLDWGNLFRGSRWLAVGVTAIAVGISVLTCGVAAPAMMAVAVVTVAAGVATTVNGVSELGEAATGHNFMRDDVFQGNKNAYNTYTHATASVAEIGTMVCGGWLKANAPRIEAYNNIESYQYTKTISDTQHMNRPYANSVLTQKEIIKYGKMTKDSFGYVFSTMGSVNGKEKLWRLGVNIGENLIWHWGHGF